MVEPAIFRWSSCTSRYSGRSPGRRLPHSGRRLAASGGSGHPCHRALDRSAGHHRPAASEVADHLAASRRSLLFRTSERGHGFRQGPHADGPADGRFQDRQRRRLLVGYQPRKTGLRALPVHPASPHRSWRETPLPQRQSLGVLRFQLPVPSGCGLLRQPLARGGNRRYSRGCLALQ